MDAFYKFVMLYPKNRKLKRIFINSVLVLYNIRPGSAIEGIYDKKTIDLITKMVVDFLSDLNLKYSIIYGKEKSISLYIYKKFKPVHTTDKQFGKYLGYICSSNDFRDLKFIKEGRYSFAVIEKSNNIVILTEACPRYQDIVKVIKHYTTFIQKANPILQQFKMHLHLKIQNELTKKIVYL